MSKASRETMSSNIQYIHVHRQLTYRWRQYHFWERGRWRRCQNQLCQVVDSNWHTRKKVPNECLLLALPYRYVLKLCKSRITVLWEPFEQGPYHASDLHAKGSDGQTSCNGCKIVSPVTDLAFFRLHDVLRSLLLLGQHIISCFQPGSQTTDFWAVLL